MITVRKAADRGSVNLGWLDGKHTFSFGEYHDPDHMGFGRLRANDVQRMTAGTGVTHSEFNPSSEEPVHFLQIWIEPAVESFPGA